MILSEPIRGESKIFLRVRRIEINSYKNIEFLTIRQYTKLYKFESPTENLSVTASDFDVHIFVDVNKRRICESIHLHIEVEVTFY